MAALQEPFKLLNDRLARHAAGASKAACYEQKELNRNNFTKANTGDVIRSDTHPPRL